MSNQDKVKQILDGLGYRLADRGAYWQTNAIFRDGDNKTAIQIYKDSGVWKDYVEGSEFLPLKFLVAKTSGTDKVGLNEILGDLESTGEKEITAEKLKTEKTFGDEVYEDLLPHHDFYSQKDISQNTLSLFKSGLSMGGKMYQRYVFPILNEFGEIHGLSGRDVSSTSRKTRPKWKHVGKTSAWVFPLYLKDKAGISPCNDSIIKTKEVIIVESIGDCINLFEHGFQNCLVSFGLNVSQKLICAITELNPSRIIIGFNNDKTSEENRGLIASIKNYCKLLSFFDYQKLSICLPTKKDFGDMDAEDFEKWREKKDNTNYLKLRENIKKVSEDLFEHKKISKNLHSKLKILPIDEEQS